MMPLSRVLIVSALYRVISQSYLDSMMGDLKPLKAYILNVLVELWNIC